MPSGKILRQSVNIQSDQPNHYHSNNKKLPTCAAQRLETSNVKKAGKPIIKEVYLTDARFKADQLESQGALALFMSEEEKDIPWQSLIYAVPKDVMAWAARATTNCLASPDNQAKWKRWWTPCCPLC